MLYSRNLDPFECRIQVYDRVCRYICEGIRFKSKECMWARLEVCAQCASCMDITVDTSPAPRIKLGQKLQLLVTRGRCWVTGSCLPLLSSQYWLVRIITMLHGVILHGMARGDTDKYRKLFRERKREVSQQCGVITFKLKMLMSFPTLRMQKFSTCILANLSVQHKYCSECHGLFKHKWSKSESIFCGLSVTYWS